MAIQLSKGVELRTNLVKTHSDRDGNAPFNGPIELLLTIRNNVALVDAVEVVVAFIFKRLKTQKSLRGIWVGSKILNISKMDQNTVAKEFLKEIEKLA